MMAMALALAMAMALALAMAMALALAMAMARKSPFTNCRIHAALSKSVAHCPYPLPPYRTVWINEFQGKRQIDAFKGKK